MTWDDYSGNRLKTNLRKRVPLILAGGVVLAVILGLTLALGNQTSDSTRSASNAGKQQSPDAARAPARASTPNPVRSAPSEATPPAVRSAPDFTAMKATAKEFVTAWASPDLPKQQWFDSVSPFLAATALSKYKTVDPSNVPAHAVTGSVRFESTDNGVFVIIVPTDAGDMRVVLNQAHKVTYIESVATFGSEN